MDAFLYFIALTMDKHDVKIFCSIQGGFMSVKSIARYALLTSLMLVFGMLERQFILVPGVPGIKLGLSNTVMLYAVCLMGPVSAWVLMLLKVLLGGLLYGGFTGMVYSLAGSTLSVIAMIAVMRIKGIGMIGISVCGAVSHMAGQVLISRVMLGSWAAAAQLPILLIAAVVTGIITGIAAQTACAAIARADPEIKRRLRKLDKAERSKKEDIVR
jgi:heptaprenyl diphosphate synthase